MTRGRPRKLYDLGVGYDDFVPVNEDLPVDEHGRKSVSVNVVVKLGNDDTITAYYCYCDKTWYDDKGDEVRGVVGWCSI